MVRTKEICYAHDSHILIENTLIIYVVTSTYTLNINFAIYLHNILSNFL